MFGLVASHALISVYDKAGVVDFARGLHILGIKIISSGGTAKVLKDAGVPVIQVSDHTGLPEMLDGRVKTLHPKVHAGILAVRGNKEHMDKIRQHNIPPIDIVAVNLYPFQSTIERPDASFEDAIENIDIGGPSLVRAAAKNHNDVAIVVDPADYGLVLTELEAGSVTDGTKRALALKAFAHTAEYDAIIHRYLAGQFLPGRFPNDLIIPLKKAYDLRYGENPHQRAAFYTDGSGECCVANATVISAGKQLSFNNIIDVNATLELVKEFDEPAAVIVKHLNPSGVGVAADIASAYKLAHSADPQSAFGCIVALNREPDEAVAKDITSTFVEVVAAPSFPKEVLPIFAKKEKMRLLETGPIRKTSEKSLDYRGVVGGLLVQTLDLRELTEKDLNVVSKRKPSRDETDAMLFAWKVCRHTKSNSIIFAKKDHTVGVGAGQMSRVDAVKIAAMKAGALSKGAAMASDAFFPFRDGVDEAAKAGITAAIHPGGSIRDAEVIQAADEHGMAMVFTGVRCFLH
ncbi:MAG: bifunctional phosphoribosylaminoimidazolecarboxamide formyltransferase/IMP cyclohydrolase [Candidatus Altiarchaeota archaeon]